MVKRKKNARPQLLGIAIVLALMVAAIIFGWPAISRHWSRWHSGQVAQEPAAARPASVQGDGQPLSISGTLEFAEPAHDRQIGVHANAAVMFRRVEMFQWAEHCAGADCTYAPGWSIAPIDSDKFRKPQGHENPQSPFASAQFIASGIHVGAMAIDAGLVAEQLASVDFPVDTHELPPNLAASFRAQGGLLYAGGDPSNPRVGELRIGYRIIAPGSVTLSGVQHGSRLAFH